MGIAYNTSIVRNGLVLHLDAANPKSYSGSGTTWNDLSGNGNHGSLINGTAFDTSTKSFVFDGTNDYVQFTPVNVQTICVWGKFDTGIPLLAALVGMTATGDGALRTEGGSFRAVPPASTDVNDFHNGYISSFMINGVSNLSTNASGYFIVPNGRTLQQDFYVGAVGNSRSMSTLSHTFMGRVYKGRIYSVCMYNRVLSDEELKRNFEALRGRYGI